LDFSPEYVQIFQSTLSSLEKLSGAMKNPIWGPTQKQVKEIGKRLKRLGVDSTADEALKDRGMWQKMKSGFVDTDTDTILSQHMARKLKRATSKNPTGVAPEGFGGGSLATVGGLGVLGTGGTAYAMSEEEPSKSPKVSRGVDQYNLRRIQALRRQHHQRQQLSQRGYYG